ncbi:NACHT domain-containing protein [Streptomyces sp. NBC_00414]|uniref:NACHT domain-containing protein n=1 Tax=Streptomyces sp. NBC_00414 TaxID=2975739 RepID=UPI002E1B85DE
MALLETAAVSVGRVVVDRAGRQWLSNRRSAADRSKPLTELIGLNFRDAFSRRRLERQLDDISDSVAERIKVMAEIEYGSLSENDKLAAIAEATRSLSLSDLSDDSVFQADGEGSSLARSIVAGNRKRLVRLGLSEAGERFYELVIQECCECLVQIVQLLPQYTPRAASEALSRLSVISANVSLALSRLPVRRLESPDGEEFDGEFKNRYLRLLSDSLSEVEVFGVPVSNFTPRATLSIAYISLSVTNEWESEEDSDDVRPGSDGPVEILGSGKSLRVESVLAGSPRNLIRGEAGSGKSTLLHWIATSASRSTFKRELASWNGMVPFLIKLRSHSDGELPAPEEFVRATTPSIAGIMPAGWVHRQLATGRALLLVDGVDELSGRRRPKIRAWLRSIIAAYPELRIVVTSRPSAAASSWLDAEGFRSAQLERMTSADVREFITHWHAAVLDSGVYPCKPGELPGYQRALLRRLGSQPHLQALATTPLLAAMLCALNLDRRMQLPRDRMGVYAAALEMLLERRDAERQIPSYLEVSLERRQKVVILQDIAWCLSMTNRSEMAKSAVQRRVQEKIKAMPHLNYSADSVLDHLIQRSGVIREPILGRIDFIHRTFQEYLTARQASEDGDVEPLVAKAHLDQWRDTVIMAAGHANSPLRRELVDGLLRRIETEPRYRRPLRLLVSACFETMPDIPRELSSRLDECLSSLIPPRNESEANSLPRAGDAVLRFFPNSLLGLTHATAANVVRSAYSINGPEALELLSKYASDSRKLVQQQLIMGWGHYDSEEYAQKVLSHVPLVDGVLSLSNSEHLPYVQRLPQVQALEFDGMVPDASMLEPVRSLTKRFHGEILDVDHRELGNHTRLEDVILVSDEIDDLCWVERLSSLSEFRAWVEGMTDLGPLRTLDLRLLGLGHLTEVGDFEPVWSQERLKWLILRKCSQLQDVSPLLRLGSLRTLVLESPGGIDGLRDFLRSSELQWLGIQDYTAGVSLSEFNSPSIEVLDLTGSKVIDSGESLSMPNLSHLYLDRWQGSKLPKISSFKNLSKVSIDHAHHLEDISEILDLPNLKHVSLNGCPDGLDLTPLASRGVKVFNPVRYRAKELTRRVIPTSADYP